MTDASHTPAQGPPPASGTAGDPFALTLGQVHLVSSWLTPRTTGPAFGTGVPAPPKDVAIGGLSLVFDQVGITLLKPSGRVGAVLPWASLQAVTVTDTARTPDGDPAVMIEVTTAERTHRFLVAAPDPPGLRAVVEEVVAARTRVRRRLSRRVLAFVALGVLVVAGLALLLLTTVGGVKL
ncbi:MAG TPA: hypothetical protein VMU09_10965 [Acidimicrobiales bacterium]|nr:hypothetical protein [Acidimicrobiales bacterium]